MSTTETTPTEDALAELQARMSPKQIRSIVIAQRHTVALWVGAVSAGKTYASLIGFLLAVLVVPAGERIIIVGRTLRTIEGNIIELLQDHKKFGHIADQVVHTRGSGIALILGRTVELIGAPTSLAEGNIRGGTIALAYVDEVTLLPKDFWAMLMTRLRVEGARCLATTNPGSRSHWLRVEYMLNAADWDMAIFHLTMRDNPSLSRAYIFRMIRSFTGMFFQRFILGLWTSAAGAIYDGFDIEHHVIRWEDMPEIERVLCIAIDYGASHATSAVLLGVTAEYDAGGRWHPRLILIDEYRHKTDHEHGIASKAPSIMAAEIRAWANAARTPHNQLLGTRTIYCDPSAKGFRDELAAARVLTQKANNDVLAGISDVSSLLATNRLVITDRCAGVIEEITEYQWDSKKSAEGIDEPVKENDDSVDAMRYAIRSTRAVWRAIFRQAYGLAA